MLTYQYELICGASWVAISGDVHANSHHEARTKVFEALDLDDPCPDDWIQTHDTPARFRVQLTETERLEFWRDINHESDSEVSFNNREK